MKRGRFKNFISKLMAAFILILFILLIILLVLGMLAIVPILLKWVGVQYDGIWSLVGFSAAILVLQFCLEGLSERVLKQILSRQRRLQKGETFVRFALDCLMLAGVVFIADAVIAAVDLSAVSILFFAVLLTLWELIVDTLFWKEENAER